MKSQPTPTDIPNHIPGPVIREPENLVENIYPRPETVAMPDVESADIMGEYLISRFEAEQKPATRVVMVPTGRSMPAISRVPIGTKGVSRWRKAEEWLITPQQSLAVILGSAALFNLVGNHESIEGGIRYGAHGVYRLFNPVEDVERDVTTTKQVPGKLTTISVTAAATNRVGSYAVDQTAVDSFVTQIQAAEKNGATVESLHFTGNTSDEWSDDASIGTSDEENTQLGLARAKVASEAVAKAGLRLDKDKVFLGSEEHVLSQAEKKQAEAAAQAAGFSSIKSAIRAADGSQSSKDTLDTISSLFTGTKNRGVTLAASVKQPGALQTVTEHHTETVPGTDKWPDVPKPRLFPFIPLLPIRKRERYTAVKDVKQWQYTPSKTIFRPTLLKEKLDEVWLRVRPEAIKEDGTFVDRPWAYTRKYEHLLRDGRIADLLRADFKNAKGEDKSIEVFFVDKSPAEETILAFEELLTRFAAAEGGKIADRVSGIFVYPSENAGWKHRDPKRIGMGIDKQSHEGVLGTYTYPLDLVELHMPSTWDPEQVEEILHAYEGPKWVLAHEVGGHGLDESDEVLRALPIKARSIPNAHVIVGNPQANKMSKLIKKLESLGSFGRKSPEKKSFDITYTVTDRNGQPVTMQARVKEDDPRLQHAIRSDIVGYEPTQYSATSTAEHFAETAASVLTGIEVPYTEADVKVSGLTLDAGGTADFASGYYPDKTAQDLYANEVGAIPRTIPLESIEQPLVTFQHINPANDANMRAEMMRASQERTLRPNQMKAILAKVARTTQKRGKHQK